MMPMNKKVLSICVISILLAVVIFIKRKDIFNSKKVLRLSISSEVDSFDPSQAFNDDSLKVLSQVYEPLYQYNYLKRPYEVIPLLAQGMPTVSSNGLVYTVKIKNNIRYHNHPAFEGVRYVKAQDFLNQIKRLAFKPLKSTGRWIFSGRLEGFDSFSETVGDNPEKLFKVGLPGVEIVDDRTVKFKLIKPDNKLIFFLAMNFVVPVPMEIIKYYKNDLNSVMVGTGPFKLASWSVQDSINLVKFKHYRKDIYPSVGDRYAHTNNLLEDAQKEIPFLDEIKFKLVKDNDLRWKLFMDKKLDVIDIPKNLLSKAIYSVEKLKEDDIYVKHFPALSSRWLAFNMKNKKITKDIRRAISYAIEHDRYLEELYQNTNLKANSIYVPGIPGYDPSRTLPYKVNLEKAKALMAKAGYKNKKFKLTYSTRSSRQASILEANLIKKMLAEIGIEIDINVLEFREFLKKGRAGELDFFTDQWIYDYPDAENLIQLLVSKNHPGINKAAYSNEKVDRLYEQLTQSLDEETKKKVLFEIEQIVHEDLPWIKLTFESSYILHYGHIKNWRTSSVIRNYLKYIDVK